MTEKQSSNGLHKRFQW